MAKEANARIRINDYLQRSGWRFFDDQNGLANITLETHVKLKKKVQGLSLNYPPNHSLRSQQNLIFFRIFDRLGHPFLLSYPSPLEGEGVRVIYNRSFGIKT